MHPSEMFLTEKSGPSVNIPSSTNESQPPESDATIVSQQNSTGDTPGPNGQGPLRLDTETAPIVIETAETVQNEEQPLDFSSFRPINLPAPETINEEVELLPPSAFLFKADGTPLFGSSGDNVTVIGNREKLNSGKVHEDKDPLLLTPDAFKRPAGNPVEVFMSPAEELVFIRRKLQDFKELKSKYR